MDDDLSNKDMTLIQFDDQQKTKIGAALQAVAEQLLSYKELDEGNGGGCGLYIKPNHNEFGESMRISELKHNWKDETFTTFISIDSSSPARNENETEEKAGISISSNQSQFNQTLLGTVNDLPTCITLIKEEPQLQNFEMEPLAFSSNEDETEVKAGISISLNQSHLNQTLIGTTNDLSTCITLTKEEPQLQYFEIEPPLFSRNEDDTEVKAGISISSNQSHSHQTLLGTVNDLSTCITLIKDEPQLQNFEIEPLAFSSNEDETEVKAGISISLNQSYLNQTLLGTTNDLPTCILTKEEPQLQNFEIEPPLFSRNEDETEVKAGISISSNRSHLNQTLLGTTNDLSTCITLTKEEPQLQNNNIEPTAIDETFSTYNVDLSYSNDIESINMHYLSDEESILSNNSCSNEKDCENNDSLESESNDGNKNDELDYVCIDYNNFIHYICPECGVDCGSRSKWKSHTEKQHLSNTVASLNFSSVTTVDGESCYVCLDCNKKFSSKTRFGILQEHHIKHLPYTYYLKCGFCDKRFQALTSVYRHIQQTHAKLPHPNLKKKRSNPKMKYVKIFCPLCQQPQTNLKLWEQHLLEKHDNANKIKSQVTQLDKNVYSCHLCQQKIHQTYNIKTHMLLHEPYKSFQCILCEKFHTHLNNALQHMSRKHLSNHQDKLLKCSYCDATFAKKSLLCNHNRNFHKNEMSEVSLGSTNHLFTNINLTNDKSQLQKFEVEPRAAGEENFSAHSRNLSHSNEIVSLNMQYSSNEGSGLSENTCINVKDNEDSVDSIESDSQNNRNDKLNSVIEYKNFVHYICPECGVDCGAYSNWIIHIKEQHKIDWPNLNPVSNVHGEPCYQCLYCNKKFSHKMRFRLMKEHHIRHMNHKYLKCGFCDKRFQALSNVYAHIKKKHENLSRPYLQKKYSNPKMKFIKIFCPICQQSQPNIKRWEKHLTKEHDYENKIKLHATQFDKNQYSCQLCQKKLLKRYIKMHMLLHEPNKSFQCILCKRYDTHLKNALLHMSRKHLCNYQQNLCSDEDDIDGSDL